MPVEEYRKALRLGLKEAKEAAARGEPAGLRVLPERQETYVARRESLGVVEIPAEFLSGTCNALRKDSFSPGFFPVLPEDSEFAEKWMSLCRAHVEEGIRDPIRAVEYLNRYYVVEGHKRVSVLRYFGAVSVPGQVTRLFPKPSDDPEVTAYYEFLDFYQMTGLNFLVLKQPGEYRELLEAMGRSSSEPWSAEEIYQFRSFYYMFREACLRQDIQPLAVPEAFLMYVKIFGYGESRDKLSSQIGTELEKIRPEVRNRIEGTGATLLLEDEVRAPFLSLPSTGKLCAAFLHGGNAASSRWVYGHEYGRYHLEHQLKSQVRTLAYEDITTDEAAEAAIQDAVDRGADLIFTTTAKLLLPSVKQAVLHPEVKILNCSLNTSHPSVRTYYPRLYEAKFIKGAIAGTMTPDGRIGYVADFPTYGSVASINAFAQGARLVNSNARVYLEWANLRSGSGAERLHQAGILYIDDADRLTANTGTWMPGAHNLALIQCRWGRIYESIVRRVLNGGWKKDARGDSAINYWWGLRQGVVEVLCSRRIPTGARRLADVLKEALQNGRLDPFYGVLLDQEGHVAYREEDARLTAEQILTMGWLSEYVVGRIPDCEEFTPETQELVRLQGVERRS